MLLTSKIAAPILLITSSCGRVDSPYLSFRNPTATPALAGPAGHLPRMAHELGGQSPPGGPRNGFQCACRVTLGPVFSQSHEDILEGIFCEVRVSSWFTFGETGHLCTRPCSKQSSLAMGEKQHFNLTSTLATLPVPPASEEGKVCLPTEEKIQN